MVADLGLADSDTVGPDSMNFEEARSR